MPEFIPNTQVKICKEVPLDSSYTDVIKFASEGAQAGYFSGKAKFTFTDFSYQRVNSTVGGPRGPYSIRVPKVADELYDCNYLCFQNTNYGTKWFYCFIKQVNYVNPNNTEIIYELDHYQTWQFDFEVLPSIVEREHTTDDSFFSNFEPEPVSLNGYIRTEIADYEPRTTPIIIVGTSTDPTGQQVEGNFYGGVYSALELHSFTSPGAANGFIQQYAAQGRLENVVCCFMSPFSLSNTYPFPSTWSIPIDGTIGGYKPRNNKLFSYPYISIEIVNGSTERQEILIETIKNSPQHSIPTLECAIYEISGPSPHYFCQPRLAAAGRLYALSSSVLPTCPWAGNVFANYWGNKGIMNLMGSVFSVASAAVTGSVGGVLSAGVGAVEDAIQATHQNVNTHFAADDWTLAALMRYGYKCYTKHIHPEDAAVIDDFFDMFGYATNRLKIPNMDSRQNWNYVKTKDVILKGSLPVDSMDRIKQMFNNGVRFWHDDLVGYYNRSNKVVKRNNADT